MLPGLASQLLQLDLISHIVGAQCIRVQDLRLIGCQPGCLSEIFHVWYTIIDLPKNQPISFGAGCIVAYLHQLVVRESSAIAWQWIQAVQNVEAIVAEVSFWQEEFLQHGRGYIVSGSAEFDVDDLGLAPVVYDFDEGRV
jgi:hypothetical protein